jgi:cyclopropane fatty-acyl-phospholipid synthase-like methyltransferase
VKNEDLIFLLDNYLEKIDSSWWSAFYRNKKRKVPFFTNKPDESLVDYIENKLLPEKGIVLELGCGNGRNSIYFCKNGFTVDGIDFSETAIEEANEKSKLVENKPNFICSSIFDYNYNGKCYDIIYDCGCFHHIVPHRRPLYIDLINQKLKKNGLFSLICFTPEGGYDLCDLQVYEKRTMKGGIGYSKERLTQIFNSDFEIVSMRKMIEQDNESEYFGKSFLWSVLFRKRDK